MHFATLSLVSAAGLAAGLAIGTTTALAQDVDVGKSIYDQYCATCHGLEGRGDGPLTELMTTKVGDLTQLAKNNDGVFPMLDVIHIIDGRTGLRAHGGPMPVYGRIFSDEAAKTAGHTGAVIETRGRILSLALYLESLQE